MNVDRHMPRTCPSCEAPQTPYTDPHGHSRFRTSCSPRRCRLERTFALAAGPRPGSFEPAQLDDRDVFRRHVPFGGNAA